MQVRTPWEPAYEASRRKARRLPRVETRKAPHAGVRGLPDGAQPKAAAAESEPVSPGSDRTASTMGTSSVPDTTTDGSIVMIV